MSADDKAVGKGSSAAMDLKEEDIYEAMKKISGYLDVTPGDFKEVYLLAYQHAVERLRRKITAREIMTREVISVKPDTLLATVAEVMGRMGVSGLPVVDVADKVVGVISEKDFLTHMGVTEPQNFMTLVASCLKSKGCVALPIKKKQAADIMTSPAVTVTEETTVPEIAKIFMTRKINRVPVTDQNGHLKGIVSRGDLVGVNLQGATS